MTKVSGTGGPEFTISAGTEYPLESVPPHQQTTTVPDRPPDSKPNSNVPSSITLIEIQRDRLTRIAKASWSKTGSNKKPFSPELVKEIHETELLVKGGRKTVPFQRVMVLEVGQYLENYLWPNFDPEKSSFEHIMSMILMIDEKLFILLALLRNWLDFGWVLIDYII